MAGDDDAANVRVRLLVRAVPVRNYLEDNVVPLLMQGMQSLIVDRPPNPVGYLGEFLVRNDPMRPPEPEKKTECEHCAHSPPPLPTPPATEAPKTDEATPDGDSAAAPPA
ncbi:set1 complex component sdc1-like isoform X2 [Selaginella moellendorffii]|uniref:set1 complex component sdc1-like isoform X2 n=1 Tax=Selaginella moellendorffii TaxID=88036 RepID=UPI000D1CBCDD|nr:set1 complex component sdc1-like isoform X2 [Selaginella moellendorffii]|eukprot:XP_024527031.1 set1 complex component sdc1-like isoform X2 [Selaginella moellendorffii]